MLSSLACSQGHQIEPRHRNRIQNTCLFFLSVFFSNTIHLIFLPAFFHLHSLSSAFSSMHSLTCLILQHDCASHPPVFLEDCLSFICKVGLSDGEVDKRLQWSTLLGASKKCHHRRHETVAACSVTV